MSQYNFASGCVVRTLAANAARDATLTGDAVDVRDLDGPLLVVQAAGAGTGEGATLDGKIQDSADGSTGWADVSGAVFPQVTDAALAQRLALNANATRGYVRFVGTIDGATPSFPICATLAGMRRRTG
jgi:hypothetical protein